MKKIGLLATLLIGGLLLTGCNKIVENPGIIDDCNINDSCTIVRNVNEDPHPLGEKLCIDNNGTLSQDEYGRDICVLADNNICPLSDVANGVCQWINYPEGYIVLMKGNEQNIPTFEELEDVVATCHVEDMGGYDYDVLKNQYILPYKDGYIGYGFGGNGGAWGYYLKYSSLDNPCEVIATTDEFFIWHADYFNEVEEFNNYEYPDDKLYVAQGGWSGIPIDTVAKELNCVAGKDRMEDDTCKKEVDRYMYNLIIGNEQNEVFTKWMNKFKNDIDNGNYTNRKVRNENRNTCNSKNSWESLMEGYGEDNRNLSNEKRREYRKIQINRIHECLENLNQ